MELIDLTYAVSPATPVFPGDPAVETIKSADYENAGYLNYQIKMGTHAGTHLDAPAHFIKGGKLISDFSANKFIGRGMLVDIREKNEIDNINEGTPRAARGVPSLRKAEILLILTGWGKNYKQAGYFEDHPVLTEGFARQIIESGVKMIGLDSPSPDKAPYAIHKMLLEKEILIIENLANLHHLISRPDFEVIALPAKFQTEAAPCRVVARVG
ncbi:MAG: cyclase family protein [Patescibacteria group bacterium]|nr:cyclase family protein [Patescibacteria group bacterium]